MVLRDGLSQREAARRFGIDRGTVSKMVGHTVPAGYRQAESRVRPKRDAHASFINEILTSDLTAPKKQRHTILRLAKICSSVNFDRFIVRSFF